MNSLGFSLPCQFPSYVTFSKTMGSCFSSRLMLLNPKLEFRVLVPAKIPLLLDSLFLCSKHSLEHWFSQLRLLSYTLGTIKP